MVGHSDKFCSKLFNTPEDEIENPFGIWMRAEPRRRMHTMGSKCLRPGGISPGRSTVDQGGDQMDTGATVAEGNTIKSMIRLESNVGDAAFFGGEKNGKSSNQNNITQSTLPHN